MAISEKLKKFILNEKNQDLINQNTKEAWEEIYAKLPMDVISEFTQTILDAGINDPAEILGYILNHYLEGSNIDSYEIPNHTTNIGEYAFCNCRNLTNIAIPDNAVSIGRCAFWYCTNLTNVVIGDSVTLIDERAFQLCSSLTSVTIPNSVTSMGEQVFSRCSNLKEIQFRGTKDEAISCGIGNKSSKKWRVDSSIQKIICTDGEIEL